MRLTPKTKERLLQLRALMLDERTKSRMRDALDAYVDLHEIQAPLPARHAIRSPFFSYLSFSRMGTSVLAFAVLLLVGGTGAAYAAEGSVPGNVLYPVKIAVIEPVQGALITSAQGQAAWHANLASRRLEEATKLAVADKLDPATQTYLQTKFNTEVTSSNENADVLVATGNTNAALDVRSDLEARITAHAEILAVISNHLEETAPSTASTTNETLTGTKTLLAAVEQRRTEVTDARIALEDTTDSSATTTIAAPAVAPSSEAKAAHDSATALMTARTVLSKKHEAKAIAVTAAVTPEDSHAEERSSEVASILLQHANLLRAFAPTATTSASITATSTIKTDGTEKHLPEQK